MQSMARSTALATLILLAPGAGAAPVAAQAMNAKDAPCRDAGTTVDMVACFSKALAARERELAVLLGQIRPAVDEDERPLLDRAQGAWVEYRRLSCEAVHAMYNGGTAGPVAELACLESQTRDRLRQLHEIYDWRIRNHDWILAHPRGR